MLRKAALVCCFVCAAALAGGASADQRAGEDPRSGIAFELNAASLRVTIPAGPQADAARRQVFGQPVAAICLSNYSSSPSERVVQRRTWPVGVDELTFAFDRDISRYATTCLLENEGGQDIAEVGFGPDPAQLFVQVERSDDSTGPRSLSFLRLRDRGGRSVAFSQGRRLLKLVVPGRYRLTHYERRCRMSCRDLGPPVLRCARRLLLRSGITRTAFVHVDHKRRACAMESRNPVRAQNGVRRTIRLAVRSAVVGRDYARACRFGTRAGRRRLIEGFNSSSGPDFPNCKSIVRSEVRGYPYVTRRLRDGVVISELRVRGGRAHARVADGRGSNAGSGHVSLRRVQGLWRIDNSDLIPHGD